MSASIKGYTFNMTDVLGKGANGIVFKGEKDGVFYAVKILQSSAPALVQEEVKYHQEIEHWNIVKLIEFGFNEDFIQPTRTTKWNFIVT